MISILVYLLFGCSSGGYLLYDYYKLKTTPIWQAIICIVIPFCAPYFYYRNHPDKIKRFLMYWGIAFGVCIVVIAIDSSLNYAPSIEPQSMIGKEALHLALEVKNSYDAMDKAIYILDNQSKSVTQSGKMMQIIVSIKKIIRQLDDCIKTTNDFIAYTNAYEKELAEENLQAILEMRTIFASKIHMHYVQNLKKYLIAFKTLLEYSTMHHEAISNRHPPQKRTYDTHYLKYRNILERHNISSSQRINYIRKSVKHYPQLKSILPRQREASALSLWMK